jgi:hypothetical protein
MSAHILKETIYGHLFSSMAQQITKKSTQSKGGGNDIYVRHRLSVNLNLVMRMHYTF